MLLAIRRLTFKHWNTWSYIVFYQMFLNAAPHVMRCTAVARTLTLDLFPLSSNLHTRLTGQARVCLIKKSNHFGIYWIPPEKARSILSKSFIGLEKWGVKLTGCNVIAPWWSHLAACIFKRCFLILTVQFYIFPCISKLKECFIAVISMYSKLQLQSMQVYRWSPPHTLAYPHFHLYLHLHPPVITSLPTCTALHLHIHLAGIGCARLPWGYRAPLSRELCD